MNVQSEKSSTLRDFRIIQELGKGSFSQVYKVIRIVDGQEYALKKVHLGLLKQKEKENALNEVRLLASIHNKHIVAYKEAFLDDSLKYLCIVMELLSGGDVFRRISQAVKGGPQFQESDIWRALIHITLGLKALHDQKIVHRDLKSANVFLSSEGTFKLGDLNVSKVAKQGFVYTQTGTPYYASPEVWRDDPYDMKSDIWSLGCVIYEMCTLQTPFRAKEMDQLYQKVQKGVYDPIPSKFSKDLSLVISQLLKPSPNQRPNCDQLLQNPIIQKHMQDIEPIVTQPQNQELLKTIQVPVTFDQLKNQFPKSNYEKSSEKVNDNKSTENSTSRFRGSQQQTKTVQDQRANSSQVCERQSTEIAPNYSYLGKEIKHPLLVEGPRPLTKRPQVPQSANLLNKDPDSQFIEQKLMRLKESQKIRELKEKNIQAIRDVNLREIQMMKNKELQNLKESLEAQSKLIRENRKVSPISQKQQINYQPQPKSYSPISRSIETSQYNHNKIVSNQIASLQQARQLLNNKQTPYKSTPTIRRRYAPQSAGPQSQYYYGNNNIYKPPGERYIHPQSAMPTRNEQQRIEMSQVFPMQARVLKQKITLNNLNNENKLPKRELLYKPTRPVSSTLFQKDKSIQQECQPSLVACNYNHYYPIENYSRNSSDQNLLKQKLQQQETHMQLLLGKRNS